ncbi:MAG: EpsI family protein [Desulfobulbaceae bacterium BRH_c16a]|nr:MAG: EpsI family protein [Desulfobulbaceae bacterium BRH_c16a]
MSNKYYAICLVIMILAAGALAARFSISIPVVVQTNLEKLPMVIENYTATEDFFSEAIYKELNADKHVYRHYKSLNGDLVNLYIGYYGTAKGGRTGHNPYACLPGQGSAIVDTDVVYLKQTATGKSVPVNYVLSRKDGADTILLHWYQVAGDKVVSTGLMQNIKRFTGRILHNRNDGAFVQVTASSVEGNVQKTREKAVEFAERILNLLPGYWPEEI